MNFKSSIKSRINRWGYDVHRYIADNGRPLNVLELAVRDLLSVQDKCFILQIGANDGKMDDPVHPLIDKYRFPGLLVEPMPDYFDQLRDIYADHPQLKFENCAVADEDGERDLFRIRRGVYANPRVQGVASFDRRRLLRLRRYLPGVHRHLEVIRVRTMTFGALLKKHGIQKIDLLQIDAEGYDYEILKMAIRCGILPAIIHYEHVNLSPLDQHDCRRLLSNYDYCFANTRCDTLAFRDSSQRPGVRPPLA